MWQILSKGAFSWTAPKGSSRIGLSLIRAFSWLTANLQTLSLLKNYLVCYPTKYLVVLLAKWFLFADCWLLLFSYCGSISFYLKQFTVSFKHLRINLFVVNQAMATRLLYSKTIIGKIMDGRIFNKETVDWRFKKSWTFQELSLAERLKLFSWTYCEYCCENC